MISYLQAMVIGLLQGVTELFPVSSLGHSVLVPAFIGGSWETLVTQSATSTSESSPYVKLSGPTLRTPGRPGTLAQPSTGTDKRC
jgi:hypothetical protein